MEDKKILCIGHPRCGTTSLSYYLNQMGYKIGHENMGRDGTSSWLLAVKDNKYPYGNVINIESYKFEKIIHVVRNPFDAIPSIILENKYSPSNKSYNFRRKHINNVFNINLPEIDINKITLLEDIEIAIKTYIYWNKLCELNLHNPIHTQ